MSRFTTQSLAVQKLLSYLTISLAGVADKISKESGIGRTVIVYAHWGEEYSPVTSSVRNAATLFAKSGAEVIVGSHPHIILPSEKIGDAVVYYSLGNFIFDQYWDSEVRTGLVLELNIKNRQIKILEHRVVMNIDGRTCLTTD